MISFLFTSIWDVTKPVALGASRAENWHFCLRLNFVRKKAVLQSQELFENFFRELFENFFGNFSRIVQREYSIAENWHFCSRLSFVWKKGSFAKSGTLRKLCSGTFREVYNFLVNHRFETSPKVTGKIRSRWKMAKKIFWFFLFVSKNGYNILSTLLAST
jgi:hypothetical protein